MFCENCGSVLEDDALFCPKCGFRVSQETAPAQEVTPAQAVAPTQEVTPVQEQAQIPAVPVMQGQPAGKKAGKKKGLFIALAAVLSVVLLVGIILLINIAAIGNFFRKTFSTPDEYYQYVEMRAATEAAEHMSNIYGNMLERTDISDKLVSLDMIAKMSEDGQKLIETFVPYDLDWLQEITGGLDINIKDKMLSMSFETALGKQNIVSGDFIADIENGKCFLKVPELAEKYLGIEMEDVSVSYSEMSLLGASMLDMNAMRHNVAPDAETVEKLAVSYMKTALACVRDVDMTSDELSVGDISRTYTKLTITIDEDTCQEMAEAILKQVMKDSELKKLFIATAESTLESYEMMYGDEDYYEESFGELSAEDAYEEFLDDIEQMLDNVDAITMDGKIKMNIWVDNKGNIVGREIRINTEYDKVVICYQMVEDGSKFALEAKYDDGYEEIELNGNGTKSGEVLSGDFVLEERGMELLNVSAEKLDTESLKDGFLNGSLTFSLGEDAMSAYGESYGLSVRTDYAVRVDSSMKKNEENMMITLLRDECELFTLDLATKEGKGKKVETPSGKKVTEITDEEELIEWVLDADWDKLLQNLEKAGIDSDIYDYLEEGLEDLMDELSWY